jgi:hypothetical protein
MMAKQIEITYKLAMAAAQDVGNRSMRAGGRSKWAVKDWKVACETFERLWPNTRHPVDRRGLKTRQRGAEGQQSASQ